MKSKKPCILLYNPISGHGHLDSWLEIFVELLIERHFLVVVLTPDPKILKERLSLKNLEEHPCLQMLPWKKVFKSNYLRYAWDIWIHFCERYYFGREGSSITPEMTLLIRWKKKFYRLFVPYLYLISKLIRLSQQRLRNEKNEIEDSGLDPVGAALQIKAILRKSKWYPDFLFNMYMDMYKTDTFSWERFASICRLPWGGIRFVPQPSSHEAYYYLSTLRGMCFLDEGLCKIYAKRFPEKIFPFLPDVTYSETPQDEPKIVKEILEKSGGRKIVFMGGSIGGQKNISRWCEVIFMAKRTEWFFVQIGEIHFNTFTPEDIEAYKTLTKSIPENVYIFSEFIPDERIFNAIINISDVLFAVYRDFHTSSNMLSKSAIFEKPILTSKGFLMGERVRRYGIGLTVSEYDSRAMFDGLNTLIHKKIEPEKFKNYREDYGVENLWDNISSLFFSSIA